MTTSPATVAPPLTTAARRFSEQIHVLVDRQTRELLLGLAVLAAEAGGYARPKEGEAIRDLLDDSIGRLYAKHPDRYAAAVRSGRRALAEREAARAADRNVTSDDSTGRGAE